MPTGGKKEDVLNTIKYAKRLGTHQALFYLPVPYPGTELFDFCKKEGSLNPRLRWEDYDCLNFRNPVYINPNIGKKEMIRLRNYAFKSYYRTLKVILRNIMQINSLDAFKKYLRALKCLLEING